MAVLEIEKYNVVINFGKEALTALNENDLDKGLLLAEKGWEQFPEPKNSWNQSYYYASIFFKEAFKFKKYPEAKIWLNRMIDNNNNLHLNDGDIWHNTAKYYYETGEYKKAFEYWEAVVEDAGYRYFENENPEYLRFFKKNKFAKNE